MPVPRNIPKTYVTWLSKLLSGDNACLFFAWFRSWHSVFKKVPQDRDFTEWNINHTLHLHNLADRLEEQGCRVFLEGQNWFETQGKSSHSIVNGKPDLIALNPDGSATIYDVKTGQPRASDEIQVKLYMFLLPLSEHLRWQGVSFDGCVVYADGTEKRTGADAITNEFKANVVTFMRRIVARKPAHHVPSAAGARSVRRTAQSASSRRWRRYLRTKMGRDLEVA